MVLTDLTSNTALVTAIVAFVTAAAGTIRYYKRTGTVPIRKLPWRAFRKLFYTLRVEFATKGHPADTIKLEGTLEEVKNEFAKNSYEPEWPLSYHYHGEDANLRRYYYDPSAEHPHRQMHTRLFVDENGVVSEYSHDEPSAVHHPIAHIRSKHMKDATEWIAEAYSKEGGRSLTLDPQHFESAKK